jgi:hypothetical protein
MEKDHQKVKPSEALRKKAHILLFNESRTLQDMHTSFDLIQQAITEAEDVEQMALGHKSATRFYCKLAEDTLVTPSVSIDYIKKAVPHAKIASTEKVGEGGARLVNEIITLIIKKIYYEQGGEGPREPNLQDIQEFELLNRLSEALSRGTGGPFFISSGTLIFSRLHEKYVSFL